ncbi:MAG TPA: SpoIIE family protein phosphatase [Spirochaetota bacterium]|nr:SpoIIE family protein phosphatase [Spirochaetota bacterium]HOR94131.1 SpoIIE family protein phosphatase [Spirochaetota bacterium]HPK43943.1 SpoIIE family protein phosphatase [Spirochaetota bacterium]HQG43698.1 SpoIIE family protein phosphatase [Spirochaetota bacterium]HRR60388.1 SpoIIE family protein phosphatase [Spirochaetota bacterium]
MIRKNSSIAIIILILSMLYIANHPAVASELLHLSNWEYAVGKPEQSYDTAVNLPFKPLQTASDLHTSVPNYEGFLWLRHDFAIPSSFANMPLLGVLLGRIMIADETYFNGELIGSTGQFPPNFFSEWNKYRLYMLPKSLLKVNEKNILLIKVYVNHEGSIAGKNIIGNFKELEKKYDYLDFIDSRINAIISFLFLLVGCYYILMYALRKKDIENLYFGLTCIAFSFYLLNFFITRLPGFHYNLLPYLLLQKIIFILIFIIAYLLSRFLTRYLAISDNKIIKYVLIVSTIIPSVILLLARDYPTFLNLRYKVILFIIIPAVYIISITVIALKQKKKEAKILMIGSIPFYFCAFWDIIVHNILKIDEAIYLMGFGFPSFLISVAAILAVQTVQYHNEVEELNITLEKKVEERTQQLYEANLELKLALEQIREQQEIAHRDMIMAVNVQRSIIPQKAPIVNNYDIGLYAQAMSGVSGDFYDFYIQGTTLAGVGLFDVSGHGIASGLLTIMSKSIVFRHFEMLSSVHLGKVLESINQELIQELENVDNYLTGILLRFNDDKVEYVNAAHTDLLLKRKEANNVIVCAHKEKDIKGMFLGKSALQNIYTPLQFSMKPGDMLLLYSDGLTEQKNEAGEEYGFDRLKETFLHAQGNTVQEICEFIIAAFNEFRGEVRLGDDLTVIVLQKK